MPLPQQTFGSTTITANLILHYVEIIARKGLFVTALAGISVTAFAGMLFCAAVVLHSVGVLDAIGFDYALDLISVAVKVL